VAGSAAGWAQQGGILGAAVVHPGELHGPVLALTGDVDLDQELLAVRGESIGFIDLRAICGRTWIRKFRPDQPAT